MSNVTPMATHDGRYAEALASAQVIVPLLLKAYRPQSVVDVGCGAGAWLSVLWGCGLRDLLGIDEMPEKLLRPPVPYMKHDLTRPVPSLRRWDVALTLEVAEHLDADSGERFVDTLCSLSDTVVWSAASPGQGGPGHINERWPSEWLPLFAAHGYGVHDRLRRAIWGDPRVSPWYRQNLLVFRKGECLATPPMLDVIHPAMLAQMQHPWRIKVRSVGDRLVSLRAGK